MIVPLIQRYDALVARVNSLLVPVLLLALRLWVARVFFDSGLTKIASWDSTLYLFEFEYQVPLLPYELAALVGTATELVIPVLLVMGLFTRPAALYLFVFNIMAVVSYPQLWEKGFYDHQLWGLMLLVNVIWGPGTISLDHWLKKKLEASSA